MGSAVGFPQEVMADADFVAAMRREPDLRAAVYDPCTLILMTSFEQMRAVEKATDRQWRAARQKERRELWMELNRPRR